jgi:predicted O-methyltransferase YrrM
MEGVSRFIKRKDMGASSREYPNDQRFVRVGDIARRSCVNRKKGELLFRVVRKYGPANILELGTSLGISTMYFALAAPASSILTIEGCIDSAGVAKENFEKAGLRNIHVITGNFDDRLGAALEEMPRPDLVFFDGNHKKSATLAYFDQVLPHIHPGTVLIFDDIHWSKGMEEAWNILRLNPRVKVSIDIYHMGFLFFRDELSKEDFTIHF